MFRDNKIAHYEKELLQLREELRAARADDEEMERRLREAEGKLRKAKEERKPFFRRSSHPRRRLLSRLNMHSLFIFGIIGTVVVLLGMGIYHYFTDIQEGVVTGKDYDPPRTVCDDDGCTTYPESWSVTIGLDGRQAVWSVSEGEYNRLRRGDWYCYTDLLHSAADCHGPPAE